MKIKAIKTEVECRAVLKEIETLMSSRSGTAEGNRLAERVTLVEVYEKATFQALTKDS